MKNKVALGVTISLVMILLGVTVLSILQNSLFLLDARRLVSESEMQNNEALANSVAYSVELALDRSRNNAFFLRAHLEDNLRAPNADISLELKRGMTHVSGITEAFLMNRSGVVIAAEPSEASILGFDWSMRPLFYEVESSNGEFWTEVSLNPATGNPEAGVSLTCGDYILHCTVSYDNLGLEKKLTGNIGGAKVMVLDSRNTFIYDENPRKILEREIDHDFFKNKDRGTNYISREYGEPHYVSYAHVDTLNWNVLVAVPLSSVTKATSTILRNGLIITACGVVIIALAILLIIRKLDNSLRTLMCRVRTTETTPEICGNQGFPFLEFNEIDKTLTVMKSTVRARERELREINENLEFQVRERSSKLLEAEKLANTGRIIASIANGLNSPLAAAISSANIIEPSILSAMHTILQQSDSPAVHAIHDMFQKAEKDPFHIGDEMGEQSSAEENRSAEQTQKKEAAEALARAIRSARLARRSNQQAAGIVESMRLLGLAGTYARTKVFLKDTIEAAAAMQYADVKSGTDIKFDLPSGTYMMANPEELRQIWTILIKNAMDATERRGPISISLERREKASIVTVMNKGSEIPEEIRKSLFEPFITTKISGEGIGLGLYLASKLVDSYGGTIEYARRENWTVFTVRFPDPQ